MLLFLLAARCYFHLTRRARARASGKILCTMPPTAADMQRRALNVLDQQERSPQHTCVWANKRAKFCVTGEKSLPKAPFPSKPGVTFI